jgi:hypothetical protein
MFSKLGLWNSASNEFLEWRNQAVSLRKAAGLPAGGRNHPMDANVEDAFSQL